MKDRIVLVGFMGAGKSTVGALLADRLGYRLVDLDEEIVVEQGRSINQIFQQEGESQFRDYETATLQQVMSQHKVVVSSGGGVVGRDENWVLMTERAVVVYLCCNWSTVQQRLQGTTDRPLVNSSDLKQLQDLYQKRLPLYQRAEIIVETDGLLPEQVVTLILEELR